MFGKLESSADGTRTLCIKSAQVRHAGEVQLAINYAGKSSSPTAAKVKSYASLVVLPGNQQQSSKEKSNTRKAACILEAPKDCTALIGTGIKLVALFESNSRDEVRWFKGFHPITSNHHIHIETTSKQSTLIISNINADDSGKYSIQIMNDINSCEASASVRVEGPPEPPSGKPSTSCGQDRVAVAWCGPNYDGGSMITGFIVEMQSVTLRSLGVEEDETSWQQVASVVDSLAYTVTNLNAEGVYRFRVRAQNIHGLSEPSLASDCVEISTSSVNNTKDSKQPIYVKAGGDFRTRFEVLDELGKGRFGVVYKVQDKEEPHQILAAKVIKCIKSNDRQKILEEIDIMKSLQHPKLLQLAASFEAAREIVMVMEYITGGELFERVVADDFTLTEMDCILFLRQVCEGCAYMHSQSIVHLDLKPENIMCNTRNSHQIKIIDFGLAQRLKKDTPIRVLFGTPEFIPPEVISYEPIGLQSDLWSIGVICYVLLSGLSPFMGDSDVETFSNITRADYDFDDEAFDCVSQEAKDFISNLLIHRKENRWSAEQCLESDWLRGHDENLSNNKICTDKLKKFIIRRKWQKTGNAIRALGRMSNLSASRRNSTSNTPAISELSNSPRPSISGLPMSLNPITAVQMSSLNEEDDDFSQELMPSDVDMQQRNQKAAIRSDSGYSECSNCSAGGSSHCHCHHENTVSSSALKNELLLESHIISHNTLKSKLEEISKHDFEFSSQIDDNHNELQRSLSPSKLSEGRTSRNEILMTNTKDPIMPSDFTNTIEMRKKSLENSASKEAIKPTIALTKPAYSLYDVKGKVSSLTSKFNSGDSSKVSNPGMHSVLKTNSSSLSNRNLAYSNKSKSPANTTNESTSLPNSPLPTRSATSKRLTGRVKEATERLAQQQTVASAARSFSPHRKGTSATAANMYQR